MKRTDLVIHPIRLRILTVMVGKRMTTAQLAEALSDVPQATLYRHVKALTAGGMLEVVDEREAHGAIERTYQLIQARSKLTAKDLRGVSADEHLRYFNIFAATLIDAFARYTRATDLSRMGVDGATYNNVVVYLTDQERDALRKELEKLLSKVIGNTQTSARTGYLLASVVIPSPRVATKKEKRS